MLEEDEEELYRAPPPGFATCRQLESGSLTGHGVEASSSLRKGKGATTENKLPLDVQVVNPFMLPRKGADADKEEEEEMTTEEVVKQGQ